MHNGLLAPAQITALVRVVFWAGVAFGLLALWLYAALRRAGGGARASGATVLGFVIFSASAAAWMIAALVTCATNHVALWPW